MTKNANRTRERQTTTPKEPPDGHTSTTPHQDASTTAQTATQTSSLQSVVAEPPSGDPKPDTFWRDPVGAQKCAGSGLGRCPKVLPGGLLGGLLGVPWGGPWLRPRSTICDVNTLLGDFWAVLLGGSAGTAGVLLGDFWAGVLNFWAGLLGAPFGRHKRSSVEGLLELSIEPQVFMYPVWFKQQCFTCLETVKTSTTH